MSTQEFGCFFCSGKSTDRHGQCPDCGAAIDISTDLLAEKIGGYRPKAILGRGFCGWTLKVESDASFRPLSVKVTPKHRMRGQLSDNEARALGACCPHRNIVHFLAQTHTSVSALGRPVPVIALAFDFVEDAEPLRKFLADENLILSRRDVVDILAGISSGLERMHSKGIWHDDLHDDNVLVRRVAPDDNLTERYEPKLIDFGSTKPLRPDEPEHGERGDYYYLAKHIYAVTAHFEKGLRGAITPVDRTFAAKLRSLGQRLSDTNVSRRSMTPSDVTRELRNANDEAAKGFDFPSFAQMKRQSAVSLSEPLENTNALTLAPQDIALLFRDSLGWQARLEKSEPVIVVGPRGCGKTMLLRYLSMESQARPLKSENTPEEVRGRLERQPYVGFLVSIGQVRTPFLRSAYKRLQANDPHRAEDFCREFISSHFVLEVARTVAWLKAEGLARVTADDLGLVYSAVRDLLLGTDMAPPAAGSLEDVVECAERRITSLSNLRDPEKYQPTNLSRDDVLERLAKAVRASSWVGSRQVRFLLDDYTVTMLPTFVQCSYNPVLFRLPATFRLKISSEGDGPVLEDHLGRKYKEGRELSRLNLGEVYFSANEREGRRFFEQILAARFDEVGKGSLHELTAMLGEHPHEDGFGEYICSQARPGDSRFHGFGLLCKLCSGDVSFIIELLHALTQGLWGQGARRLKPVQQDEIVKRFAQRQLADLRRISEHGSFLYEFAERVGNLLKEYLLVSKAKQNPDERLRIEIEGPAQLSPEAQRLHEALLRHSVLIDGGAGKSRRGLPTRRLFFRRLFAPCFPFSPTRKGCVPLTVEQYQVWLLDPKRIPTPTSGPDSQPGLLLQAEQDDDVD
jgi:tRNA A-37 threonylcarbamoyl transferase component Bud32